MKILLPLFAAFLLTAPLRAIELSLEENRTQRGSVGYVDMQRVFAESPDSATAKESFETIVREAEERVNLKRAELLKLRRDLADVKADREKLANEALTPPAPASLSTSPVSVSLSSAPAVLRPAFAATPGVSTAPVAVLPAPVTALPPASLPGMPPASAGLAAPTVAASSSTAAAFSSSTTAVSSLPGLSLPVATSTSPAVASVAASTSATREAPIATRTVATNPSSMILDLDTKIIALQAEILRKEESLARERNETDRGLVSIEGRKTDLVLVHIYAAITAVARQESISIVVDRGTILYGHQGVDLTDKVLQYLRNSPQ